jgi:hypothetical protein
MDLKIGGKLFAVANMERRTVLHDLYLQRLLRRSGLDRAVPDLGEEPEAYSLRLYGELVSSGVVCELLGGYLLPVGTTEDQWSPEVAAATSAHLGACNTEEDRRLVHQLAAEAVLGFFRRELRSLAISRISSRAEAEASRERSAAH